MFMYMYYRKYEQVFFLLGIMNKNGSYFVREFYTCGHTVNVGLYKKKNIVQLFVLT